MANDEIGAREKSGYDKNIDFAGIDIDKAVGPGDILKDVYDMEAGPGDTPKDSDHKVKYLKKALFVLLLAVIGFTVFGASLIIGEKIFLVYQSKDGDSSRNNVAENRMELPAAAVIVPKVGIPESAPATIVKPASAKIEKGNNTVMLKEKGIQPAPKGEVPVAKAERPEASSAKPKITAPDVKPAVTPKPAAKKIAAAKAPKTHKEYKVMVGSFSTKAKADRLIGQLKAKNYEPIIVQAKTPKGQVYRVLAGSYRSLNVTKTKIGEIKGLGHRPFYVFE
jgi:cell division septation protein DedD